MTNLIWKLLEARNLLEWEMARESKRRGVNADGKHDHMRR